MTETWAERFVDKQVDQAWRELRADLAERFVASIEAGEAVDVDITTPDGKTLTVQVEEDVVVLMAGNHLEVTANVDEAAYDVCRLLREEWQVIHPVFLDSEVVAVPAVADNPIGVTVPTLGRAQTPEQLLEWVVAAFNDGRAEPVKVAPDGDIVWLTERDRRVTVSVRTDCWVEVWTVLAERVSFSRAHKVMDRLARKHPATRFALDQDRIIASRVLDAGPFVPQHLFDALAMHLDLADELTWVAEKVLRKRARGVATVASQPGPPAALLALLPAARSLTTTALVDEVGSAAGSEEVLEAWKPIASREWAAAQRLPRDAAADPQRVNARLLSAWRRIYRAIEAALDGYGREAA